MKDSEIIIGLLRTVAARMRFSRALREAGFALCVVLFALAVFELIRVPEPEALNGVYQSLLVAGLVGFCALVLVRALKRVSMAQAAGLIDARLPLHDELKSAYWFVSQQQSADENGAFVRTHVANAARTAQQLQGARIMPLRVPRSMLLAILPALLLVGAMWGTPEFVRAGSQPAVVAQSATQLKSARALLAAKDSDEQEIKQLDRALAMFEKSDVSPQQLQEAVDEAREAMDQVNMRATIAREGFAKLARAMRANPQLAPVADALEQGRTAEAIAMLEKLRGDAQARAGTNEAGAGQSEVADTTRAEVPLDQSIGQMSRDLAGMVGNINDDALARLIDNLDDMQRSMEMQDRINQTRARSSNMSEMMLTNSQRSSLTASRFEDREMQPSATPSPESGKSDLRGGTMFRQGALSRSKEDEGDD
ncbi:MAG: hypothetical protein GTO41_24345, partial [Burkholderiales bacterium]|nr:hypothetical protein [Burkholderiales bacterium]